MSVVRLRILGECVIQVRQRCIAPDAPQLFALLLYLCRATGRTVHKMELLELLFPEVTDSQRASHNLRQLLYRLRGIGAPVETEGERIQLSANTVTSSLDDFASLSRQERLRIPASGLSILPLYEPGISPQLADWIETVRARATVRVKSIVRDDFRAHRRECDWESVVASGGTLRTLGASSEEVVSGVAEALLMLGRKHEALDEVDAFLAECEPASVPALRQLRGRIERAREHSRPVESAFRGRGDVMRALGRQWSAAMERRTQVAIVIGPPGIGKSRLAREFSSFATLNDGQCLAYRYDAADNTRPHSLFNHLLPHLRSRRGSLGADPTLRHHLDRLSGNPSIAPQMGPASLEATRSKLQFALVDLVQAVAAEKTQLLVIDDAQFLDSASRSAVEALCNARDGTALLVLCCYRGSDGERLSVSTEGAQVHHLMPLTDEDSLAVLTDLLPRRQADQTFLASSVLRAGGNPYFLHAVAHGSPEGESAHPVPFDVRTFAAAAYFSLAPDARTLFDACLLLGRFANLKRVREIASIDGPPLLTALRALEEHGLLSFSNGELRCTHALLEEAARSLIPSAVAAALNERIAQCLEQECESQGYAAQTALAAAACWIAVGDVPAASRLLQHCAAHAGALGEPGLAANTLLQVPRARLPAAERVALLHSIVEYAEVAGSRELVCSVLREILVIERDLTRSPEELREIEFRIVEADLWLGLDPRGAIPSLTSLLADPNAPVPIRVRAGTRLLVAADMNLDADLAASTIGLLRPLVSSLPSDDSLSLRSQLIYETSFGDQKHALEIIGTLLSTHPVPALTRVTMTARRNVAVALSRMGLHAQAAPVLLADYHFMTTHRVVSEAGYRAVMLADSSLAMGDFLGAASWLQEGSALVGDEPRSHSLQAAYHWSAATLALSEGNLCAADRLIEEARVHYPAIGLRYRAVALSLRLKLDVLRGLEVRSDPDFSELTTLFELGETLGAQDCIVEALWLAHRSIQPEGASALLATYLHGRRRELGEPEALLRSTTAQDRAWHDVERARSDAAALC